MGGKFRLLKTQKDAIYDTITSRGFSTDDFVWGTEFSKVLKEDVEKITYVPMGFRYIFSFRYNRGVWVRFSLRSPGKEFYEGYGYFYTWKAQLKDFRHWLRYVAREKESPGYWFQIVKGEVLSAANVSLETENEIFGEEEIDGIRIAIERMKTDLTGLTETNDITGAQFDYVESQLDYLSEALERLGKRDWVHTAIGVLATFAASKIDVSTINQFWIYLQEAISGTIQFLPSVGG